MDPGSRGASDAFQKSVFCGRQSEMALLREAFDRIAGPDPEPQVLVLLAESGLGKTRIAQEFYQWLSTSIDVAGPGGYWPDQLDRIGDNLRINPDPADCDNRATLPFLWWGLRLRDPAGRNQAATNALADGLPFLHPHLHPLYVARRRKERLRGAALATAETVVDFIPPLALAKTAGNYAFELLRLGREEDQDRAFRSLRDVAFEKRKSVADALVLDLSFLLGGKSGRRIPAVLLVDDAHFSHSDPDVSDVVDRLIDAAFRGGWPFLILITHWESEWQSHSQGVDDATVARIVLKHRHRYPPDWHPISLGRVADLEPMLIQGLPGLTTEQRQGLLERADGNPRLLDEIVRFAASRPRYFQRRDPLNALTPAGLAALRRETVDLHTLVAIRLKSTPVAVQEAVALGSIQGMEFIRLLTIALGEGLESKDPTDGLDAAEVPHAFVRRTRPEIMGFAQRIYQEVARDRLADLFDEEAVAERLAAVLGSWIGIDAEWYRLTPSERLQALILAQGLPHVMDMHALSFCIRIGSEVGRLSAEGLHRQAVRFARMALTVQIPGDPGHQDPRRSRQAFLALGVRAAGSMIYWSEHALAQRLATFALDLATALKMRRGEAWTPDHEDSLARAHCTRGEARSRQGDQAGAVEDYDEALRLWGALKERPGAGWTPDYADRLSWAYQGRGSARSEQGDRKGALEDYHEVIQLREAQKERLGDRLAPGHEDELAGALMNRGLERSRQGDSAGALEDHDEAIRLWEALKERLGGGWTGYQNNLARAHMNRGIERSAQGDQAGAVEDHNQAIRLWEALKERLGEAWPPDYEDSLAGAHANRGMVRSAYGDPAGEMEDLNEAIRLQNGLKERLGEAWTPGYEDSLAAAHMNRGTALTAKGHGAQGVEDYDAAIGLWEALKERLEEAWTPGHEDALATAHTNGTSWQRRHRAS
jgi:tetratricopeptide (TPR) repeat protein